MKIEGLTINEAEFDLRDGISKGKVAVLVYYGGNPTEVLNSAVRSYVGEKEYYELIDANMDNPWMCVVVSNINDMKQENFDDFIKRRNRKQKLKKINEIQSR